MNNEVDQAKDAKSRRTKLKLLAGYIIGIACLIWVFHDVKLAEFLRQVSGLRWPLAALALLVEAASYLVMGTRWRILLKPGLALSPLKTTQAIYAGMFLSQALPLRVGELARGVLVAHWSGLGLLSVLPSMALERFFEAFWMALGLGVLALLVPLPPSFLAAGKFLGVTIAGLAVLLLAIVLRKPRPFAKAKAPGRIRQAALLFLRELRDELRDIGLGRRFFAAFGMSLVVIGMWALTFWMIMRACGIREPMLVGFAVWLITHLGIALPNSPGNVGSYQFFCVLALLLFGVDKTAATSFSITVFVLVSIPQVALGAVSLAKSGMTISTLTEKARSFRSHLFAPPVAPTAPATRDDGSTAPGRRRSD